MIKTRPQKTKTTSQLIAELDAVFSFFIKLRDTDGSDRGKCITCNCNVSFSEGDCGHGITRHHMATRWDERNCALQCRECNRFEGGRQEIFAIKVDERCGAGTWDYLLGLSRSTVKLTPPELIEMIEHYKNKTRRISTNGHRYY